MTHSVMVVALAFAISAGHTTGTQAPQQAPPTFRAGVDLVVVDVVVVNKDGAPVTDLGAADFTITAGTRPRRIVSSGFVSTTRSRSSTLTMAPPDLPAPTSNSPRSTTAGRSIFFVVDVEEIRAGEGRSAMRAIAEYVDGLDPADRVGIVSLPYGTPRLDLTTNRTLVREALGTIAGTSLRMREGAMTPGEAAGIAVGDTSALTAWRERTAGWMPVSTAKLTGQCLPPPSPVEQAGTTSVNCKDKAERALDGYRLHTRNILDSLRAMAEAMAPLDGQKALVLVSEGLYNDPELRDDLRRFAAAAERARVALYAMHLDSPLMEAAASGGPTAQSRLLDDHVGFGGMADVANAARGTALRVIAHSAAVLKRIDSELSGYYLLAFERSADDRDGDHVRIDVKVNRPGLDVRARTEFRPTPLTAPGAAKPAAPVDSKVAMGTVLRWPAPLAEIGIDVDTFTLPVDAASRDVRVMIAAEIAAAGRLVDVGFEVKDAKGKTVADSFDPKADLRSLADGRGLYPVSVSVAPGKYTLTLGVIDGDGKRGSVMHAFEAKAWPAGPLRMSSVILGEVSGGAFRPSARPGAGVVAVRVEVYGASPGAFVSDRVRIDVVRAGEKTAALSGQGRLVGAPAALRRVATTLINTSGLAPGDYIVSVVLESPDGTTLTQASRVLRRQ